MSQREGTERFFLFATCLFFAHSVAGLLPDGTRVNFLAVGSYIGETNALALSRSSDGKMWFYSHVLRTEFPPTNTSNSPLNAIVAYGSGGGPAGQDVWVVAGDSVDPSGNFHPTIYYSLDDGDSFLSTVGTIGPGYPSSVVFGNSFWLAFCRSNSSGMFSVGFFLRSTDAVTWVPHVTNLDLSDNSAARSLAFVNNKWFAAYGQGLFSSLDGVSWTKFTGLPSFDLGVGGSGPTAFAISPFEEYWGVGGPSLNGSSRPCFVYSNDGKVWNTQAAYIPFSVPLAGDQYVHSMAYGAGQFVIVGGAEFNKTVTPDHYLNTVLTAVDPSSLTGLGKTFFFDSTPTYTVARNGKSVIYSERLGLFVLCGARGNQGGTSMAWSINPKEGDLRAGTNGDALGMFTWLCMSVATRDDRFSKISGAASGSAFSTKVVLRNESLVVSQSFSLANGDLKAGGALTINSGARVNSTGSMYFSGTTRVFQGSSTLAGLAAVVFPNTSILEVAPSAPVNGSTSISFSLFNFSFFIGNFSVLRSVNLFDSCTKLGDPSLSYASSSLSVLISVDSSSCNSASTSSQQGLSTGAIVGIAVGAAVGGVALAVGIVVLIKFAMSHHDNTLNRQIKESQLQDLRAAQSVM